MSRIIVLTASRASELKERILRAKKMDGLSEREGLFLADLLHKLKRGAGGSWPPKIMPRVTTKTASAT